MDKNEKNNVVDYPYEELVALREVVDEQLDVLQSDAVDGASPRELLETARKLVEALEQMVKLDV